MSKKLNKIVGERGDKRCPPKAKVVRSNRIGCTSLPLPNRGQLVEIPQGFELLQRIEFVDWEPKLTQFLRRSNPKRLEIDLKSRRGEKPRARSA